MPAIMPTTSRRDPTRFATQFSEQQARALAQAQNFEQQALLNMFRTEVGRQNSLVDRQLDDQSFFKRQGFQDDLIRGRMDYGQTLDRNQFLWERPFDLEDEQRKRQQGLEDYGTKKGLDAVYGAPVVIPNRRYVNGRLVTDLGGSSTGDALADSLVETAFKYGVDPAAAIAMANFESGGNPNAANPVSSAHGVFQIIDSTWEALGGGDRRDPRTQIENGIKYMAMQKQKFIRQTGREPDAIEHYIMHFTGNTKAATASPDAPITAVLGPDQIAANGQLLAGVRTVGDFRRKVAGALAPGMRRAKAYAQQLGKKPDKEDHPDQIVGEDGRLRIKVSLVNNLFKGNEYQIRQQFEPDIQNPRYMIYKGPAPTDTRTPGASTTTNNIPGEEWTVDENGNPVRVK